MRVVASWSPSFEERSNKNIGVECFTTEFHVLCDSTVDQCSHFRSIQFYHRKLLICIPKSNHKLQGNQHSEQCQDRNKYALNMQVVLSATERTFNPFSAFWIWVFPNQSLPLRRHRRRHRFPHPRSQWHPMEHFRGSSQWRRQKLRQRWQCQSKPR